MIADLKPYAEYRESGLPWVGQIPGHWTLAPNRALLRRRKVLVGKRHSDFRLLSLTKGGVIVRDITTGKGKFSADMGTSQEVRTGDLVFCLFDVPETPRTVGLSRYDGMITGAYTVFECFDAGLATYLDNFYRAMDDRKLLSPLYSGLRNTIPPTRFLGIKSPLPPPDEQAAIVRFLNYVNRRLEKTIRAKAHLGVFFSATLRGIVSFHYGVFSPRRDVSSKYYELLYHTNPYKTIYAGRSNGMTVGLQNLSNQNFYNVRSPVPPLSEQIAIIEFINRATAEPDYVIASTQHEISLLHEYRTRLIADVVTGKLDVREAAARLPEEDEELEEAPIMEEEEEVTDDL